MEQSLGHIFSGTGREGLMAEISVDSGLSTNTWDAGGMVALHQNQQPPPATWPGCSSLCEVKGTVGDFQPAAVMVSPYGVGL